MSTGWTTTSLAEKIPEQASRRGLGPLQRFLENESLGLRVEWEFSLRKGWLEVRTRGEDGAAFLNFLQDKFGEIPGSLPRVEKWDTARGYVVSSGRVGFGLYFDLGVFDPVARDGLYPLHRMRAQLADGVSKSSREIIEDYGLVDDFPVTIRVIGVENEKISVELSDETLQLFASWNRLPFDRVVAVGVSSSEAEIALKAAKLWFDVIRVEPLSMFTQCLVCKIGTDAPGVVAKLGSRLPGVRLAPVRAHSPIKFAKSGPGPRNQRSRDTSSF